MSGKPKISAPSSAANAMSDRGRFEFFPDVFVSVIPLGEIERGIERIRSSRPAKAAELDQWPDKLQAEDATPILPIAEAVAMEWGRMSAHRRRLDADGLILATAKVHDLVVATRNVADFADTGVRLVNPWQA